MARAVGQTVTIRFGLSIGHPAASKLGSPFDVCTTQKIPRCGVSRCSVPFTMLPCLSLCWVTSAACRPAPATTDISTIYTWHPSSSRGYSLKSPKW